jgi:hypothetical protein
VTYLRRVALEIKDIGLYDLILQDVQKIAGKNRLSEDEILSIIKEHPQILEEYKQLNVEYNLSNIHLRDIDIDMMPKECTDKALSVNSNLALLRDIEKYTLDFEQSSTLVIIFSIEFFVLFSVQYFIVLLNLKQWQTLIYGLFASSVAVAWWYAKKEQKKYATNKKIYEDKYSQTLALLNDLENSGCINKSDLIIKECEEHV